MTKVVDNIMMEKINSYRKYLEQQNILLNENDPLLIPSKNPKKPKHIIKQLNPKSVDYIFLNSLSKGGHISPCQSP